MESIIKIFRRVMLAVVIIPFLSVFALPNYSNVFATDNQQFNGLTIWDKNGNYLTTDATADAEHKMPENEGLAVSFAGGKVWTSGATLYIGKTVDLGENNLGQSLVNTEDSELNRIVVYPNASLYSDGDFISDNSLTFDASITSNSGISIGGNIHTKSLTMSGFTSFSSKDIIANGSVNITSYGGINVSNVTSAGNIFISNQGGMSAESIKASNDITLSPLDNLNIQNGVVAGGTFSLSRQTVYNMIGDRTFKITSLEGYGIQANKIQLESVISGPELIGYSSYDITGPSGAFSTNPTFKGGRIMMNKTNSRFTNVPSVLANDGVIDTTIDGEQAKRVKVSNSDKFENSLSGNDYAMEYGSYLNLTDLYTGGNAAPVTVMYKIKNTTGSYITLRDGDVLNAGVYDTAIQQDADMDDWIVDSNVSGTITVSKALLTASNFQDIEDIHSFDGSEHVAIPAYVDGLTGTNPNIQVTYKTFDGHDITGAPKDVGAYRVFASVPAEGDNYLATTEPIEIGTVTIVPANVPSNHIQVGDLSHIYDGKDHKATVSLDSKYGTITSVKYMTEYGTVVDNPTNAGRYEVLLSTSSENYVPLDNEVVGVLNISRATPTSKDFKFDDKKTYTGLNLDADVKITNNLMTTEATGAVTIKYNGNADLPINVGRYEVTVETTGGTNYNPTTVNIGTFEITRESVSKDDLIGTVNNATYDGKEHGASYDWKSGMIGTGTLTLTYKGESYNSTAAPVNAGTYGVYASASAGANYQALESVKIADVKISKANLTAKNFNNVSANYVYDFKSHPAKVTYLPGTEGTSPITVTYKTATGKTVSGAPTNAGTYEVYAQTLKAGVNYNAMAKPVKVGTIKIAKADKPLPQIKVSDNEFTYDGKSHQAKVMMDKKYGDLTVAYKDEQGKTVAKPTNAGVYQIVVNTVSENFEELHDITVGELTIEGLPPKITEFTYTKAGTYNGKSQSAKVAFAPGVTEEMAGKMTVHYVDAKGNKTNSIKNAGTYKLYVSTTGGTNFKPVNNLLIGNMTIEKASVVSDEFSVKGTEVTFNGQPQSPTVTAPAKYGDITKIEYRDENGKIYDKVENPGKYGILVTTKGTANYAGTDRLVVGTFTIDEQTPEPTPAPNDNGGTPPAASTVVPASGPAAYNATTTVPATNVGTTTSAVAPATQTPPTTGTGAQQTQATATPAADNATIRHGSIEDSLHGPEEVGDPVKSAAQKENDGLSNYTIAGIWIAVAIALAGVFYIGMRWMQVGRKRHMIQR